MKNEDNIPGLDEDIPGQMVMERVVPPEDDNLATITKLSQRLIELSEQMDKQALDLKKTEDEIKDIADKRLPDLLNAIGLSELRMSNGRKVSLNTRYFASIPKAKAEEAFNWLRQHNMSGVIKEALTVPVAAKTQLMEKGIPFQVDASIHPSTLKALVKEQIEAGNDFPRELFGVFVADTVVIK